MEVREFSGKTVEEALTAATMELGMASSQLNYEVIEEGSSGFLGMFKKPALIRVSWEIVVEKSLTEKAQDFCDELFKAMKVETKTAIDYQEEEKVMNIDLSGPNMGILIGKRGQTLDALQYLISLLSTRRVKSISVSSWIRRITESAEKQHWKSLPKKSPTL